MLFPIGNEGICDSSKERENKREWNSNKFPSQWVSERVLDNNRAMELKLGLEQSSNFKRFKVPFFFVIFLGFFQFQNGPAHSVQQQRRLEKVGKECGGKKRRERI
jgi:hypothetical protein